MSDLHGKEDKRPSPDALLNAARQEGRGRLKIFLGAAPGVGKTYEMLQSGRARLAGGTDVVIAVVETHGRKETNALVDGFEIIGRRQVAYHGRTLDEMDVDAVLARRPKLALVDELAHSNAPESRHSKRYMDVEDILAAGIDVYTTLNIQHVESLNDVVAQITGIRVRETVPDSVLDGADDIEVIDLSPADLINRLREGKVYLPTTAKRAVDNFFQPGNLTALRELALRRTAQRVDEQLLTHMKSHAISGPWAAGERVLVCISEDVRSQALVRYAKRLSDRLHAPFEALYVETARSLQLSDRQHDRIAEALRLAEHLGGEATTLPGSDRRIADDVIAYARGQNANHIIIGKSERSRLFEILHGSVVHDMVRKAGAISVHVIAGDEQVQGREAKEVVATGGRGLTRPLPYLVGLVAVGLALGFSKLIEPFVGIENVDLIFLVAIIGVASRFGLQPALLAMVMSSLAYNFFFLPPLYTFTIASPTNVVALFIFTIVTFIVSNLAARVRSEAITARARARTTEALYSFSRKLAGVGALDDVLWATVYQIASMLKVKVVVLLAKDGDFGVRAGYPPEDMLEQADIAAAKWAFEHDQPAGRGSDTLPGAKWLFLPLKTGLGTIGAVGVVTDRAGPMLTSEQRRLLDALSDQAAIAIERVYLVAEADGARRSAETDRLRSALLTSISHDLKTPLAAIMGAAATLREYDSNLDDATKTDLLQTVQDESERLNRFIANLLDMTKLESGAIEPNVALYDLDEILGAVLRRANKILREHKTVLTLAPDLPMLRVDPVLFEQALFNLLDNAAKYAPEKSEIRIAAAAHIDLVTIRLFDEGPGIPVGDLDRIFDKFYRVQKGDRVRAGTGLGLSIARGFVESMGGTIAAGNRSDRSGAVFTIQLPIPRQPDPRRETS